MLLVKGFIDHPIMKEQDEASKNAAPNLYGLIDIIDSFQRGGVNAGED